jgi:hypothetical protein
MVDELAFPENVICVEVKTHKPWLFQFHDRNYQQQTIPKLPYLAFQPDEMLSKDFFGSKDQPCYNHQQYWRFMNHKGHTDSSLTRKY